MTDRWKPILSTLVVFCFAMPQARSQLSSEKALPEQPSTETLLCRTAIAAGATVAANATMQVNGTVAQGAIGTSAGKPISTEQGFWHSLPRPATAAQQGTNSGIAVAELTLTAFPNSFSQSSHISLHIRQTGHLSLTLYDLLGKPVRVLIDDVESKGTLNIPFTADELPSGRYTLVATDGDHQQTLSIQIVK